MLALSPRGTPPYDLVIFDCDGVLVDSEVVTNRVFAEMLGELGVTVTLEYMFEHFMGHSMSHCLALVRSLLGRDAPADFLPEYRRRSEEVLARELEVVPGVVEVLDALTVPWCVASNGPRDKMAVTLGKTGLLARCEAKTFTAYEVARPKPAPDLFLSAAARFGVPPPRVAVVERLARRCHGGRRRRDVALRLRRSNPRGSPARGWRHRGVPSHARTAHAARHAGYLAEDSSMSGPLSESAFAALVEAGCPRCRAKKVVIEALLVEKLPLLAGEVFGSPSWAYKGEDFVRGTYRIECQGCRGELFSASACPRCGAPGGVQRALEQVSDSPLPRTCGHCGSEQLAAKAFAPARVVYEGKRADKPRPQAGPEEPGFHPFEATCKGCGQVVETKDPCPLCGGDSNATSTTRYSPKGHNGPDL